jgi:hypothetical protein
MLRKISQQLYQTYKNNERCRRGGTKAIPSHALDKIRIEVNLSFSRSNLASYTLEYGRAIRIRV